MACDRWGNPVDKELHRFGLCSCAIYPEIRPARPPCGRADIERLLGLMGFSLHERPDGTFYAHDPEREITVPRPVHEGEPFARLGELVIRVGCAHSLQGPMTAAQARARLAPMGVTLSRFLHRTWGWEWVAYHAASDHRIEGGFHLAHLIQMTESYVRYLGHTGSYQPVLEAVVQQAPRPKLRPEQLRAAARPKLELGLSGARVIRRSARAPAPVAEGQATLDLFAGGVGAGPGEPPSRDEGGVW
ncbi:MAG: hypothetical protein WCI67_18090 [Chloroflexales bacterium]